MPNHELVYDARMSDYVTYQLWKLLALAVAGFIIAFVIEFNRRK